MTLADHSESARATPPEVAAPAAGHGYGGVAGNARLTALAGAALLVLLVIEVLTTAKLRALLSVHIVVGVLLAGPLAVKLASTGWRFLRYYTRSPAYVRRGPPLLPLRLLAPLLLATTLVMLGSGLGLLLINPLQAGPLLLPFLRVHVLSTLLWMPLIAIHVGAYVRRTPRLIADEWRPDAASALEQASGRGPRLTVGVLALGAGAVAAVLLFPFAAPWQVWVETNETGSGFFIVGTLLAILAVLSSRPQRWWGERQP